MRFDTCKGLVLAVPYYSVQDSVNLHLQVTEVMSTDAEQACGSDH